MGRSVRGSARAPSPAALPTGVPIARVSLPVVAILVASRGLPASRRWSAASLGVPLPGPRAPSCRFARRGAGGGRCPPTRRA